MSIIVIENRRVSETLKVCRPEFEQAVEDLDTQINALLKEYPDAWNNGQIQVVEHPTAYIVMQQWFYNKKTES